jgi:hypothetical protein
LLKQRRDEHPFAHKVMVVDKTVVVVGTTEGAMARRPPIVDVGSTECIRYPLGLRRFAEAEER